MANTLQDAIRALASVCDGAQSEDGAGFNKADARWGRLMALESEADWHPAHKFGAWETLRKYRRQLAGFGIEFDAIPVPEENREYADLPELPKPRPRIKAAGQTFVIAFPYNAALVSAVKRIPGARFDGATKSWSASNAPGVADAVRSFADGNGFDFTPEAAALLDAEPVKPVINLAQRKIVAHGKDWKLIYPYDAALVAAVKALTSRRRFDPETKSWICEPSEQLFAFCEKYDFSGRKALRAALDAASHQAQEEAQAGDTLTQMLIEAVGDLNAPLPGPRGLVLRHHQQEGVLQLLAAKRAIPAHDMGLGKTLTCLIAAKAAQEALDAHVFVVAPVSLRTNWMREAEEAGVRIEFFSWAKVPQAPDGDRPFVAIFDEAHYMQNIKAARTKNALALAEKALMAFFPTGTPIKNGRPVNLYPLLKACNHPLAANKSAYEKRYCAAKETRFTKWDVSGAAHLDELHAKTKDVLFRKTKAECLDLPALTRVKREAEVTAEQAAAYSEVRERVVAMIQERKATGTLKGSEALELLTALRVAGSRAKSDTAIELAEEVIEQGGQVIVSTQFQETAQAIAEALGCEALTGATPADHRQGMVDRFQAGQRKAIVFTGGAGGVGLNLQAANTVILVDRPWTPGDSDQIESRAHRSGVNHPVTAVWLQYNGVDQKIDNLLELKQQRINLVLEGERKTMRGANQSILSAALEALGVDYDEEETE